VRSPTIGTLKPEIRGRGDHAGTSGDTEIRSYHVSSNANVAQCGERHPTSQH
jgi:hypothetical protein